MLSTGSRISGAAIAILTAAAMPAAWSQAALAGTAPACIQRVSGQPLGRHRDSVWITNTCGKPMRVKIIVKRGFDSSCMTLANQQTRRVDLRGSEFFGITAYHKTVTC